jgi:hypothetical protein
MQSTIPLYVGFDPREAAAYHVFCQSVIERASVPVSFHPLHKPMLDGFDGQKDGSNAFIYSRFLVPYLQGFQGWAVFADGDMVCLEDIAKLLEHRDICKAACVVKHDYKTKHARKYIDTHMEAENLDYPRKNWSSLVLWNCSHAANRLLTPEFVSQSPGSLLHRFGWLKDDQIGEIPPEWNALSGEQDLSGANLIHYTLGVPALEHYHHCDGALNWHRAHRHAMTVEG